MSGATNEEKTSSALSAQMESLFRNSKPLICAFCVKLLFLFSQISQKRGRRDRRALCHAGAAASTAIF